MKVFIFCEDHSICICLILDDCKSFSFMVKCLIEIAQIAKHETIGKNKSRLKVVLAEHRKTYLWLLRVTFSIWNNLL